MKIEDYALIGDLQTAALVRRDGSVDWLCLPRFDSTSCFAALLGDADYGRWLMTPAGEIRSVSRCYRPGTLALETDFQTADGDVRVVDLMPRRGRGAPQLARIVEPVLRPDYASVVPWVDPVDDGILGAAGHDAFHLSTPRNLRADHGGSVVAFDVSEGGPSGSC